MVDLVDIASTVDKRVSPRWTFISDSQIAYLSPVAGLDYTHVLPVVGDNLPVAVGNLAGSHLEEVRNWRSINLAFEFARAGKMWIATHDCCGYWGPPWL